MRVNAEMRVLGVQGIVRLKDISTDNTIRYDQIAEARVSYGGAGRVSEVQQPALLHQIYDRVSPF
jgi:flagellar L-ring protein precursor FlgH